MVSADREIGRWAGSRTRNERPAAVGCEYLSAKTREYIILRRISGGREQQAGRRTERHLGADIKGKGGLESVVSGEFLEDREWGRGDALLGERGAPPHRQGWLWGSSEPSTKIYGLRQRNLDAPLRIAKLIVVQAVQIEVRPTAPRS